MFDFLEFRLFKPLNIKNAHWDTFADGNSQGAVGLHISADDAAKLGELYLNNGIYNGQRILSEAWIKSAQSSWSDNSESGVGSWGAGYGFQFWLNENDGFRADGSFGQLCVIMPSKNMVFSMQAFLEDIHGQLKLICDFADEISKESDTAEAESDAEESDFCDNKILIKKLKPTIEALAGSDTKELTHFAAYCYPKEDGMRLHMNFLDNPYVEEYILKISGDEVFIQKDNPDQFSYNGTISGRAANI